jgi:Fe2+ transport system protein FeoA
VAIRLVRTAPLGDPLEIEVRGYKLTLRKSEAEHVMVEPANDP